MSADKVVGDIIKGFSEKGVNMTRTTMSYRHENLNLKIPYDISDEVTRKYISDFKLNNPQELVRFLIEVGFSAVEVVSNSINDVKTDIMNDVLAELDSIKVNIVHDLPAEDANERLRNYQKELIGVRKKVEKRVQENINRINSIDKMSPFERKIKAAFILKDVDGYTQTAQICLKALLEIIKIHIFIADYIGDKNFEIIQNDIDEFMNKVIFCNNNISMMNDWATKEERDFWSDEIRKQYSQIMEQHKGVYELFEDMRKVAEEQHSNLEDIVFE